MTTTAPARSDSPTNLRHEEAAWRSSVCQVPSAHVAVDVTGAIDRHEAAFSVRCLMGLDIRQRAEGLWVDFVGQTVDSLSIDGQPAPVTWDGARIELPVLDPGEHTVEITARGLYSNSGQGLHRFHDPVDGATYLYTHFEPSDARRAWPVMEQPDIKTRFSLEVTHPRGWTVMSNTRPQVGGSSPQAPTGTDRGCETTSFAASRPLPSYLTALAAGPWHRVTGQWTSPSRRGLTIPLSWSCRASLAEHLDATELLDLTRAGLDLYDRAYDYGFPWDSYDSVLVPEYNLGAMENPGCVTFNEELYLFRGPVTRSQRAGRANTILHEMCHMWFGDLVTPTWWEDTWLKETFADHQGTWAEAEAAGYTEAWVSFASTRKAWAYLEDSRPATTHPIVARVDDVEAARQAFDGITYAKGASVLKQLVYYVGREKFFKGINNYLNKHAYSNATLADLLAELELTSGRDLKAWSAQWLEESGINTIATEVEENEDGTIKRLALRQTAPAEHPVLRAHRLAVGFYNEDPETGKIVRTDRFELDVDGELTVVDAAAGKARPSLILVNDDDLTYTKLRFDDKSLAFATSNLYRFDDALARSVIWLALWDMTRDGELPARQFIDTSLAALATEHESTTFRYALAQVSTTAWHYTAPAERAEIVKHVAAELFKLAGQAKAGSDEQFQLVTAYLGYGEPGDEAFVANAKGLLDGSVAFDGLEIDNNFRWTIINALSTVNAIDQAGIDAELAKRETTENREFAYGARAVAGTAEAKAWAWNEALHNDELTNMQLEAVAGGFAATPRADLAEPYAEKYFEVADWIWEHKTFHMAEALLEGLYPGYADPAKLVELGDAWLASHKDADNALQRIVRGNVEASHRTLKVRDFNAAL